MLQVLLGFEVLCGFSALDLDQLVLVLDINDAICPFFRLTIPLWLALPAFVSLISRLVLHTMGLYLVLVDPFPQKKWETQSLVYVIYSSGGSAMIPNCE